MKLSSFSFILLLLVCVSNVSSWASREMQMFDLVEELGGETTFYSYLGVAQSASPADIRRAYRKLSLKYHPDKNEGAEAHAKFRQMASIYEVLRDPEMRAKYDNVLENGLPDWRAPIFYVRKFKKLSFWQTAALLTILCTAFHYVIVWGHYIERKFTVEQNMSGALRRRIQHEMKRGISAQSSAAQNSAHDIISGELRQIPAPRLLSDLLPVVCVRGSIRLLRNTPHFVRSSWHALRNEVTNQYRAFHKERLDREERELIERELEMLQQKKREAKAEMKRRRQEEELRLTDLIAQQVLERFNAAEAERQREDARQQLEEENKAAANQKRAGKEWTQQSNIQLVRAMKKYPAGTPARWNKIAEFVEQPVSRVIEKTKQLQHDVLQQREKPTDVESFSNASAFEVVENSKVWSSSSEQDSNEEFPVGGGGKVKRRKKKAAEAERKYRQNLQKEREEEEQRITSSSAAAGRGGGGDATQIASSHNFITAETQSDTRKPRTKAKWNKNNSAAPSEQHTTHTNTTQQNGEGEQSGETMWPAEEVELLQQAMRRFPKGTPNRLDCIAQQIPARSKEECLAQIKVISSLIKNKSGGTA